MKNFIIKSAILGGMLVTSYLFFVNKISYKQVDDYYCKFTRGAGSLIIGISRAHDGLVPKVLEEELSAQQIDTPVINFAFEKSQSPYGEVYLEAVKKKIEHNTGKGVFILSVTPGAFMEKPFMDAEDIYKNDKKMLIGKVDHFCSQPNYDYIMNCYSKSLYNVFTSYQQNYRVVHPDGWMEVNHGNKRQVVYKEDIERMKERTKVGYSMFRQTQEVSLYRMKYFIEMVKYLKSKGSVILVRIPADKDIITMENKIWENFDHELDSISTIYKVPYLNYTHLQGYKTYDGAHLFSDSAKKFTHVLSRDLKNYLTKK